MGEKRRLKANTVAAGKEIIEDLKCYVKKFRFLLPNENGKPLETFDAWRTIHRAVILGRLL